MVFATSRLNLSRASYHFRIRTTLILFIENALVPLLFFTRVFAPNSLQRRKTEECQCLQTTTVEMYTPPFVLSSVALASNTLQLLMNETDCIEHNRTSPLTCEMCYFLPRNFTSSVASSLQKTIYSRYQKIVCSNRKPRRRNALGGKSIRVGIKKQNQLARSEMMKAKSVKKDCKKASKKEEFSGKLEIL